MKANYLIAVCGLLGSPLAAQNPTLAQSQNWVAFEEDVPTYEVLSNYLELAIDYPKETQRWNEQGVVYAEFYIDEKGTLTQLKIVQQVDDATSKEILRELTDFNLLAEADEPLQWIQDRKYRAGIKFDLEEVADNQELAEWHYLAALRLLDDADQKFNRANESEHKIGRAVRRLEKANELCPDQCCVTFVLTKAYELNSEFEKALEMRKQFEFLVADQFSGFDKAIAMVQVR